MPPSGRRARPSWLLLGLRTTLARAYPRVIGANRELSWVFFDILLPLLAVLGLLYVYRALGAPPRFEGYVIVGGAMTSFWFATIWMMAMQLRWEKDGGNLEFYMIAPPSLMWVLAGMALGGSFSTTLRALTVVALGALAFEIPFVWTNLGWALLATLATITALYSVGMAAASLFLRFGRGVENVLMTLQEPVFLVTGTYFPVRALGLGLAMAGSLIPLTLGVDAQRQLLFAGEALPLLPWQAETVILAAYTALMGLGARFALDLMERWAKRDGRLTLRWQ
jgi:ABC-2 type transport system permease protein